MPGRVNLAEGESWYAEGSTTTMPDAPVTTVDDAPVVVNPPEARTPVLVRGGEPAPTDELLPDEEPAPDPDESTAASGNRRSSGRVRHDEKITVYVSSGELFDLEQSRLVLRGKHGLAVDRGRIVREALAYVLADLDTAGDASILVRRLRDR